MMIIMKRENKKCTMKLLTNNTLAFPNPNCAPFQVTPLSLYAGHHILWCGMAPWPVWVTRPGCALSQGFFG